MIPKPTVSTTATDAYRKQQGMAKVTQSYDPKLVGWIAKAAKETGADPTALLATAIQESGARLDGAAGDGGTSFGPFQFHVGGALGNHSRAWASSYAAVLNRAQEFARLGVHAGKGAAAVQRPQDQSLYARGVDSHISQSRAILSKLGLAGGNNGVPTPTVGVNTTQTSADPSQTAPNGLLANNGQTAQGINSNPLESLLQTAMSGSDPSQQENGSYNLLRMLTAPQEEVPAPTLINQPAIAPPALVRTGSHEAQTMPGGGLVTSIKDPKIIGTPYQGTHTIGNWQSDNAVDIAMPVGTPIYAASDGIIGDRIGSLNSKSSRMAGLRLTLQGKDNSLYYAHLSKLTVKAGERVKAGQLLGYSGSANGVAHLHLGAEKGNPGKYA